MAGKQKKESFAARVLAAVKQIGGEVCGEDIINLLTIQTRKEHKRLNNVFCELTRAGKLERVRTGYYRLAGSQSGKTIQSRMWSILRSRRTVAVADLQELAGASSNYAREWLQMLARRGVVKRTGERWLLIKDPGPEMQANEEKAARLRRIRVNKKNVITALDKADKALAEARKAINKLDKEMKI